jgi:hypothetical protein
LRGRKSKRAGRDSQSGSGKDRLSTRKRGKRGPGHECRQTYPPGGFITKTKVQKVAGAHAWRQEERKPAVLSGNPFTYPRGGPYCQIATHAPNSRGCLLHFYSLLRKVSLSDF